ncbi:polysaccharide deacetylase family protein [Planomicrobium okeanokoites]|uniref:polysaccharide deacetylase family protein n=1 Tax=Planomicrobium okeanokoites TaxID=244 RepID=UPI0009FBB7B0|nr:polysaccharide deacetylase family protein [Planomicrobium okeanokoites]
MRKYYVSGCLFLVLLGLILLPIHMDPEIEEEKIATTIEAPGNTAPASAAIDTVPEVQAEPAVDISAFPSIPVLMYHILLEERNDVISVDPLRFREQMSALKEAGFTTITDYQLADHLRNKTKLPDKPILITFDDGYKSVYTEAFPVLEELGMKATVNVIASRIFETPSTLHPEEYEKFTWPEARSMEGTVMVQAHTWDSHNKKADAENELKGVLAGRMQDDSGLESQEEYEKRVFEDLLLSKKTIEEKMGYDVVTLAYPYGHYSEDTIRLAQVAGYQMAFTVKSGLVNRETDAHFELDRITANGAFTGEQLLAAIEASQ